MGGLPFNFKISTTELVTDGDKLTELTKVVNSVKNVRSVLESFELQKEGLLTVYLGIVTRKRVRKTFYAVGAI